MSALWRAGSVPAPGAGVGLDGADLFRGPTPQPMVKDAVVFAPIPDKGTQFVEAARRLLDDQRSTAQPESE